ncbi:MAG: DUF4332 domain-containing protein [Acetatifactor sp.]|nr:DUF4332 domain-containing protein [Acetatifactor sp.]
MATKQKIGIVGVDENTELILEEKASIMTIKDLSQATRTSSDRALLAEKTNLPIANVAQMAVQAELMRIRGMTKDEAYDFIGAGIYSVEQFKKMSSKEICEKVKSENPASTISETRVIQLKEAKARVEKLFDVEHLLQELVLSSNSAPSAYSDLCDVISELGKGIAQAQQALDESSIAIQNKILENDEMYAMGLQATWYAIPETEFTLKMDYATSQNKLITGKTNFGGLKIAPSNATFQNLFKTDKREESTLKLKIVPIPATDKMLVRKLMPDFKKAKTVNEILSILEDKDIEHYKLEPEEAVNWGDEPVEVTDQYDPGKIIKIGMIPEIKVSRAKK